MLCPYCAGSQAWWMLCRVLCCAVLCAVLVAELCSALQCCVVLGAVQRWVLCCAVQCWVLGAVLCCAVLCAALGGSLSDVSTPCSPRPAPPHLSWISGIPSQASQGHKPGLGAVGAADPPAHIPRALGSKAQSQPRLRGSSGGSGAAEFFRDSDVPAASTWEQFLQHAASTDSPFFFSGPASGVTERPHGAATQDASEQSEALSSAPSAASALPSQSSDR